MNSRTWSARQTLFASPIEQFRFKLIDRQAKAMISLAKRMGKKLVGLNANLDDVKYCNGLLRQYGVHPRLFNCAIAAAKEFRLVRRAA
jgi:hypothetical protein